jgi:DNA-binding transcriptional LysR family regulator
VTFSEFVLFRALAINTSIKDEAVISVLIAAIVGSISSRNAVNIRLVSGWYWPPEAGGTLVMKEVMLPICSPAYRNADEAGLPEGNTIIKLADTPGDWAKEYPRFLCKRSGPTKILSFTDYAVVVQATLLGQGIALGWLTVTSHWLLTGALVPASDALSTSRRICEFLPPRNQSMRPVASDIKDWIIEQMRNEVSATDRLYPHLGLMTACY